MCMCVSVCVVYISQILINRKVNRPASISEMFGMYFDSDSSSLAAFSASSDVVLRFLTGILQLRQGDQLKLAA